VLTEEPSYSKESETDDIIRSIIEIHSISFTSDSTFTEQLNSQNYQGRIASQIVGENLENEMIPRVINNYEQVMAPDRRTPIYRPRTSFPHVSENANLGSNINVARTTQRFRHLLPINMRSSNTDFNRDQSGDYSPNTANRSIITAPSRPRSILVRSLINRNEDTTVESTENQG
jgi:hypothetical protein